METNLFKYVWHHSWRDQIKILVIVALGNIFYLVSLDLPKRIVNDAILGHAFAKTEDPADRIMDAGERETSGDPAAALDIWVKLYHDLPPDAAARPRVSTNIDRLALKVGQDAVALKAPRTEAPEAVRTAKFLKIEFGPWDWIGVPKVTLYDGMALDRLSYLVALSLTFLFFVVINGWMKQVVNVEKGRLGERMLRRLRYQLFDRVLRFPLGHFRKVKQAEIATMIKDEIEPLGGFIGDAYIQPAFLGGLALTALYYVFSQSISLGLVTLGVLGVQIAVIPKLRVKVLQLGKQRQITARQLAGRIAETVDGAAEIHVNDTSNYERADIVDRLGRIFQIRFELYQRKFFVKYLNNMLASTTPFLFYLIGGYLALKGHFDVGSLVAAINAYKDLPSPIKELIDWDQQRQDVQIKYDQVIEQFTPDGMMEEQHQAIDAPNAIEAGPLSLAHVALLDEGGSRIFEDVSLELAADTHLAIIGPGSSGKEQLALILGRLLRPSGGQVRYNGQDFATMSEATSGRRFAYVGDDAYFFPLSLRENMIYGLKHRPVAEAEYEESKQREVQMRLHETERSGNPLLDPRAMWIDLEGAGLADREALDTRLLELLKLVEVEDDVYQFGLRGRIDPKRDPEWAKGFMTVRAAVREHLAETAFSGLVEPFDPAEYNSNMTVAENLLFGTATGPQFLAENLTSNDYLMATLKEQGLDSELAAMGAKIAETMVELFADLPVGHPFFDQFSFIAADDLPMFKELSQRVQRAGMDSAAAADRARLIALTFPYVEARHRLELVGPELRDRLLAARRAFHEKLPDELKGAIEFYDPALYNAAATVQDNMLFGRMVYGQAQAVQKVGRMLAETIEQLDLKNHVIEVGLDFNVGGAGKKLSTLQRQKSALVRALLKQPLLLVLNHALAAFDDATQRRLARAVQKQMQGSCLVLVTDNLAIARNFDQVLVMKDGRKVELGPVADLDREGTAFHGLIGDSKQAA